MKKILLSLIAVALFSASAVAQTETDVAGDYQGKLYISLGEPINEESECIDGEKVSLVANEDGTVDFKLKNFAFADMTLGDIEVNHLHLIFKGNFAKFSDVEPVNLVFNQGTDAEIHATALINEQESYIRGERIVVDLPVMWTNVPGMDEPMPIYVLFDGKKVAQAAEVGVKDIAGGYEGQLFIALGEEITDETEAIDGQKVELSAAGEDAVNFKLPNFAFGDMTLGDIEITSIKVNFNGTATSFEEREPVKLVFNEGTEQELHATALLDVNFSSIWGDAIDVLLNVMWTNVPGGGEIPINVRFIGVKTTTGINNVTIARPATQGVYSIDGRYVGKELDQNLTRGIYIVGGQKVLKK